MKASSKKMLVKVVVRENDGTYGEMTVNRMPGTILKDLYGFAQWRYEAPIRVEHRTTGGNSVFTVDGVTVGREFLLKAVQRGRRHDKPVRKLTRSNQILNYRKALLARIRGIVRCDPEV